MGLAALESWIIERALPLWGRAGWDAASGQFVEQLDFDGAPRLDAPRRSMVQARQIYVYGTAKLRGWRLPADVDAAMVSLEAGRALVARYWQIGGRPGWAFSVDRSGHVLDPGRDLYAQAFVLLALSTLQRLAPGGWRGLAEETLTFLEEKMRDRTGGFAEVWPDGPASLPRRQNPHMHLFEALLAWVETDPGLGTMQRAEELRALCERRFVATDMAGRAGLVEYFEADWTPRGGPDFPFEPGHHFEWAWLLAEYARLSGGKPDGLAARLCETALKTGFDDDGCIRDEVALSGRVVTPGTRLWPHTEAIRCMRTLDLATAGGATRTVDAMVDTLMRRFLLPTDGGLWFDHFDGVGRLKRDHAPASSLYHLIGAIA